MMKHILVLILIVLHITSCGNKCEEAESTKKYLQQDLDGYFGVFKKGNYWVYENQDKTQKDSIYVTASDRNFFLDKTPCNNIETIEFTVKQKGKDVIIYADSMCIRGKNDELRLQQCMPGTFFINFLSSMHFAPDTVYCSPGIANRIRSVTLNNNTFSNEIIQMYYNLDTIYMQKHVGIIGWKKNNNTYNLVNKYLQP